MIMSKYYEYINQPLKASIITDLERIKFVLNYHDKKIFYRDDKYFTEFIFDEYKYKRDSYYYLERIFDRVNNNIRISRTNNDSLIVVIEKFPKIFVDEV